jgi:hypothetical protein
MDFKMKRDESLIDKLKEPRFNAIDLFWVSMLALTIYNFIRWIIS